MSTTVILALSIPIILVIYYVYIYPFFISPLRRYPGPPGNPLIGPSLLIMGGPDEPGLILRDWVREYGPTVRVVGPVGTERLIFMDPKLLGHVLVSSAPVYPRPKYLEKILGLVAGHGLLTVSGDVHKKMRRAMNPAFSIANLMSQVDMYHDSIQNLVKVLSEKISESDDTKANGKVIHMYEWLGKVTLDIISETALGYKTNSVLNPKNELAVAYETLANLQSGPNMAKLVVTMNLPFGPTILSSKWLYNKRHWLKSRWFFGGFMSPAADLIGSMAVVKRISSEMLQEKIRELSPEFTAIHSTDLDSGGYGKKDIMSLLVKARAEHERQKQLASLKGISGANNPVVDNDSYGGGYGMDNDAMMDQVLTFLAAGHETTASGLAWALYLLASNPSVQDRLRAEVTPCFSSGGRPDYRTIKDLKWLDCVVMESLRLYPPVPVTVRRSIETDYIDGVLVPKGTMFLISIRAVNSWKGAWGENAEEYDPSRWLNLPETYNSQLSFLSFIAGPHACIGKTMAIFEMKTVLGGLVANFSFEPAYEGQKPKPAAAITMKPKDGMPLRVKRIPGRD